MSHRCITQNAVRESSGAATMSFSTILLRLSGRTRATTLKLLPRAYPLVLFRPVHMTTAPLPPFDDTPLERFAPCDDGAVCDEKQPNGFIPCSKHPISRVLGKNIDLTGSMELPKAYRRHLVVCVGEDGPEWMRAKVEAVEGGIVATVKELRKEKKEANLTKVDALEGEVMNHSKKDEAGGENKMKSLMSNFKMSIMDNGEKPDPTAPGDDLLITVCDRVRSEQNPLTMSWPTSDILLLPDFKLFHDIEPHSHSPSAPSTLSNLMNSLDPHSADSSQWLESLPHRDLRTTTHAVIFVCTHTLRDKRCGVIGPSIVSEFKTVLAKKGILTGGSQAELVHEEDVRRARQVTGGKVVEVYGTSHVGGE